MEFLGVSGTEFAFLALVALVIFGPTGMPKVARAVLRGWSKVAALRAQMEQAAEALQRQAASDPLVAQLRAEAAQARAELERAAAVAGSSVDAVGPADHGVGVPSEPRPAANSQGLNALVAPVTQTARSVAQDLGKLSN